MFSFKTLAIVAATAFIGANAESHTVSFTNNCGYGTPQLIVGGNVVSSGGSYTSNGPIYGAISYLQTGSCGFNGEGCTTLETTLVDPQSEGAGSSTDISLISPHSFSVATGFGYYNGCDGSGADCASSNCYMAFRTPTDYFAQVQCESNGVNLAITFCD